MRWVPLWLVAWAGAISAAPHRTFAHELPGSSATLVVRDGGFVELRLLVPWADILRAQMMPRASRDVFLGTMVNQAPAAFARTYAGLVARIERDLRVVPDGGPPLAFRHWQWPAAGDVQDALRRELMARLALPSADHHSERLPATADVSCDPRLVAIQLQTASALGPMLVTAYRSMEQFVQPGARTAPFPIGK